MKFNIIKTFDYFHKNKPINDDKIKFEYECKYLSTGELASRVYSIEFNSLEELFNFLEKHNIERIVISKQEINNSTYFMYSDIDKLLFTEQYEIEIYDDWRE